MAVQNTESGWFGEFRRHTRSWAMSPFDRVHTTSYSTLIESMQYASILYRFRDTASCLSKVTIFTYTHLHSVPPLGVIPVKLHGDLWPLKTRLPGPLCGTVNVFLC